MQLLKDDCLVALKQLPENSVESLITDPPAGISFMGKDWDKDKGGRKEWIAWMTEVMAECHRVMKPGAHGLVWAIPRTSHWTATALEDAGFEVRDVITHHFGSGFPKSLDISKAIDKAAGAEREIVGESPWANRTPNGCMGMRGNEFPKDKSITAPATDSSKQWSGWGTALKPSVEKWIWVTKKSYNDRVCVDSQLLECNVALGDLLCRILPAKLVQNLFTPNQTEGESSAQWIVGALNMLSSPNESEKTDTFKSPVAEKMFWSIVCSWKSILDVSLNEQSTFTTSTKTSLITELRILKSYLSAIILANTIQGKPTGTSPPASNAQHPSNDENIQKNTIHFAQESVLESIGLEILNIFVNIAAPLSERLNVKKESFALTHVIQHRAPDEVIETSELQTARFVKNSSNTQHIEIPNIVIASAWLKTTKSHEIVLIRKPISEKTVAANVIKWGCGGINIDASRISLQPGETTHGSGTVFKSDIYELGHSGETRLGQPNIQSTQGRFPANLLLSHTLFCADECAEGCPIKELDEQSGHLHGAGNKKLRTEHDESDSVFGMGGGGTASRFFKSFSQDTQWNNSANTQQSSDGQTAENAENSQFTEASVAPAEPVLAVQNKISERFFYCAKASKRERNAGLEGMPEKEVSRHGDRAPDVGRQPEVALVEKNHHPTVKPQKLMQYLIKLITPPNGVVLDPFMGSGSTGVAAKKLGFGFIGIEKEAEYFEIAEKRIGA